MNEDFELETDASDLGLSTVLKQKNRAVAYAPRSLNKTERNYSITEKEMLAGIWAMEKFRYLLVGRKFTLITDHKPLTEINKKVEFGSARIQRWFERLQRFHFEEKYRPGNKMTESDALSRSVKDEDKKIKEEIRLKVMKKHKEMSHRWSIL